MIPTRRRKPSFARALLGILALSGVGFAVYVGALRGGRLEMPASELVQSIVWTVGAPEDVYNFGVVVPGRVYRSGQPDERFIRYVHERYGVRRLISLNGPTPVVEVARELGMIVHTLHWKPFRLPPPDELEWVLSMMDGDMPVLVHCQLGCDRVGYAIAAYRMRRQGWRVGRAVEEMVSYGHDPIEYPWMDVTLGYSTLRRAHSDGPEPSDHAGTHVAVARVPRRPARD
jgi:hypothetical protein